MHYYLDQPVASIGGALGIAEGAVKNALHKARGTLLAARMSRASSKITPRRGT